MQGIAGFFDSSANYLSNYGKFEGITSAMAAVQSKADITEFGLHLSDCFAAAQVGLRGRNAHKPFSKTLGTATYAIVCNGEIYNLDELKGLLGAGGQDKQVTEILLDCYIKYGKDFINHVNGVFAIGLFDGKEKQLILYRDRLGVKPLFYTVMENTLVFSSLIKGLFCYPEIKPKVDIQGLNEIFSLGPARTEGCGVFKGIKEVLPGHMIVASPKGVREIPYWQLVSGHHSSNYDQTLEKTRQLLFDSIKRQSTSDLPLCAFLSGGLDSSIVSAVCAKELQAKGEVLRTFSFDFTDNNRFFLSNSFQPSQDRPFVEQMVKYLKTEHTFLECDSEKLAKCLELSVDAHDLPCMADIDSSLLYFCSKVSSFSTVALTGECADEIFGGYPWFYKPELLFANIFPWSVDLSFRKQVLNEDFLKELNMDAYVEQAYENTIAKVPRIKGESPEQARHREVLYLNIKWFMQTLLNRMDRCGRYWGLNPRVPFADVGIVEYLWNVPWDMKAKDGVIKGLLRACAKELLPEDVLYRRKSPYPKTYNPEYESLVGKRLTEVIHNCSSPISAFLDKEKVNSLINSPSDLGKPWYGQLMAGPQMLAYLLQVDYWLKKYKVEIV